MSRKMHRGSGRKSSFPSKLTSLQFWEWHCGSIVHRVGRSGLLLPAETGAPSDIPGACELYFTRRIPTQGEYRPGVDTDERVFEMPYMCQKICTTEGTENTEKKRRFLFRKRLSPCLSVSVVNPRAVLESRERRVRSRGLQQTRTPRPGSSL